MLYAGHEVVLKEYNVGDDVSKKMFENQVFLMKRLANHPLILPIDAVFYDRNAYIQMQCILKFKKKKKKRKSREQYYDFEFRISNFGFRISNFWFRISDD